MFCPIFLLLKSTLGDRFFLPVLTTSRVTVSYCKESNIPNRAIRKIMFMALLLWAI
ncbi:hypothetical protein GCM10007971_32900 [Oceanobacillus indicireducens]|uniref:Uncharacterized protein n=1 Tax=Oceanobacillus indicireducens TaxID=1004261 RepID=A0A918D3V5_9BACI|nr:hypothetical protein GCM10007971_32900 [Oceanobacillus indicireducens]